MADPQDRLQREFEQGYQAHVALNVISRCNSRCVFCFEGERSGYLTPSTQEAMGLIEDAAKVAGAVVFMGGEALLRQDIVALIQHCTKLGLVSSLFTNGLGLAREGTLEACASAGLARLHVSVHAWDRESWSRISGLPLATFDRFLEALHRIRAWYGTQPRPRMEVNFQVLPFTWNVGHLDKVVQFVLEEAFGAVSPDYVVAGGAYQPQFLFKGYGWAGENARSQENLLPSTAAMKEGLGRVAGRWEGVVGLGFSRIPLCQIPGHEHLGAEVRYLANCQEVWSNFSNQGQVQGMMMHNWEQCPASFRAICQKCSLVGLCGGPEGGLPSAGATPSWAELEPYAPEASGVDPAVVLVNVGLEPEAARAMAVALTQATQEGLVAAAKAEMAAGEPGASRFAGQAERVLRLLVARNQKRVGSYRVAGVADHPHGARQPALRVLFEDGEGQRFEAVVEPAAEGEATVYRAGSMGIRYLRETPMDSIERQRLLRLVAAAVEAVLGGRGR